MSKGGAQRRLGRVRAAPTARECRPLTWIGPCFTVSSVSLCFESWRTSLATCQYLRIGVLFGDFLRGFASCLGHASIPTTARIYAHLHGDELDTAADA